VAANLPECGKKISAARAGSRIPRPTSGHAAITGELEMTDYRVVQGEATEDQVTAAIEKVTSQVPSSVYLAAALASMAVSVGYKAAKKTDMALFIGQWAAPFLILGIYNKLVKIHGSDGTTHA
jgi:hypothetical protein